MFILGNLLAQNEVVFNTWEELSINPAYHEEIILDCANEDYKRVLESIESFSSLRLISFYHLSSHADFPGIDARKDLGIRLVDSPDLQVNKFLNKISDKETLQELHLIDNNLTELPKNLSKFRNLQTLNCSGNGDLEMADNLAILDDLDRITSLTWTSNDATSLPSSIRFYSRLQHLDLSSNGLIELPKVEPSPLRNLTYLNLNDNIIIEMEESLRNLGMRIIKEVYLDGEGLSGADVQNIETLHSKARFYFLDLDTTSIIEKDSILNALIKEDSTKDEDGGLYGKLKIDDTKGVKILSTSYLHYPEIFNHGKFKYTFDTTSFEGRYQKLSYENVRKILPGEEYENIDLSIYPWPEKGEVWFEFGMREYHWFFGWKTDTDPVMRRYINRYNKEVNAFRNMVFVLQGDMVKKEFKKAYAKDKYYTDFRLYYNEGQGNFKLELKDLEGFQEIYVYPRYKSKSQSLEKAQESYTSRSVRYSKYLQRRKAKFHNTMKKNKLSYDRQYNEVSKAAWKTFTDQYLSDEEKAMSREDWLLYYDKVVANEKRALDNAEISLENLRQSLLLSGYMEMASSELTFDNQNTTIHNVIFTDEENNRLAVTNYAIIDRNNKLYSPLVGGLGQGSNLMLKGLSHRDFEVVVELRNGDMGVVTPVSFRKFELSDKDLEKLEVEIYSKKLSHIGLFWDRIEF